MVENVRKICICESRMKYVIQISCFLNASAMYKYTNVVCPYHYLLCLSQCAPESLLHFFSRFSASIQLGTKSSYGRGRELGGKLEDRKRQLEGRRKMITRQR